MLHIFADMGSKDPHLQFNLYYLIFISVELEGCFTCNEFGCYGCLVARMVVKQLFSSSMYVYILNIRQAQPG